MTLPCPNPVIDRVILFKHKPHQGTPAQSLLMASHLLQKKNPKSWLFMTTRLWTSWPLAPSRTSSPTTLPVTQLQLLITLCSWQHANRFPVSSSATVLRPVGKTQLAPSIPLGLCSDAPIHGSPRPTSLRQHRHLIILQPHCFNFLSFSLHLSPPNIWCLLPLPHTGTQAPPEMDVYLV